MMRTIVTVAWLLIGIFVTVGIPVIIFTREHGWVRLWVVFVGLVGFLIWNIIGSVLPTWVTEREEDGSNTA